jgi:hypothetical protein
VAAERDVALAEAERFAGGDADLFAHEIEPEIISLIVCSTWMRVFISRKKNSSPETRHSIVPTLS